MLKKQKTRGMAFGQQQVARTRHIVVRADRNRRGSCSSDSFVILFFLRASYALATSLTSPPRHNQRWSLVAMQCLYLKGLDLQLSPGGPQRLTAPFDWQNEASQTNMHRHGLKRCSRHGFALRHVLFH